MQVLECWREAQVTALVLKQTALVLKQTALVLKQTALVLKQPLPHLEPWQFYTESKSNIARETFEWTVDCCHHSVGPLVC